MLGCQINLSCLPPSPSCETALLLYPGFVCVVRVDMCVMSERDCLLASLFSLLWIHLVATPPHVCMAQIIISYQKILLESCVTKPLWKYYCGSLFPGKFCCTVAYVKMPNICSKKKLRPYFIVTHKKMCRFCELLFSYYGRNSQVVHQTHFTFCLIYTLTFPGLLQLDVVMWLCSGLWKVHNQ